MSIALETGDTAPYTAPVLPGSEIPALIGLASMEAKRTVLDLVSRMDLMGPGDFTIQSPPGSHCLQLYTAESGHTMFPVTEYQSEANQGLIQKGTNHTGASRSCLPICAARGRGPGPSGRRPRLASMTATPLAMRDRW